MLIKREVAVCDICNKDGIDDLLMDSVTRCNNCNCDLCRVHYSMWRKVSSNAKPIELCPNCEVKMLEAIRLGKL